MFNFENTYSALSTKLFSKVLPTPVTEPSLVCWNEDLANKLGLDHTAYNKQTLANLFSGNQQFENSIPIAQAYAGHQFGHFNILGDGRTILLGEHVKDNNRFDIQLKGSGPTPYSRRGDGRGTLSSMLREYLMSEAIYSLGIATSRSLTVVETKEIIQRQRTEHSAILTRVNSSHLRVGTFEYARYLDDEQVLSELLNYAIKRHYPTLLAKENPALAFVETVMNQQIDLIVDWMRVGFIHGVMNTDNCTISGETIDYGPCAFMNAYDPKTVFSSIDTQGRYAFGNQPAIVQWNMSCLAGALLPLIHEKESVAIDLAQQLLNKFPELFKAKYETMLSHKLGFEKADQSIVTFAKTFLNFLATHKLDYTNAFLALENEKLIDALHLNEDFNHWRKKLNELRNEHKVDEDAAHDLMQKNNPSFIPRNHLVEEALNEASFKKDMTLFNELLAILKRPYERSEFNSKYQTAPSNFDSGYQTFCGT